MRVERVLACCHPRRGDSRARRWGNGELGPATSAPVNASPVEVTLPGEVVGRLLATGAGYSLVTSAGGQLFGLGDDVFGESGLPGYESLQPPLETRFRARPPRRPPWPPAAPAASRHWRVGQLSLVGIQRRRRARPWRGHRKTGAAGRGDAARSRRRYRLRRQRRPHARRHNQRPAFSFGENHYGQLGRSGHSGTTTPTPNPGLVSLPPVHAGGRQLRIRTGADLDRRRVLVRDRRTRPGIASGRVNRQNEQQPAPTPRRSPSRPVRARSRRSRRRTTAYALTASGRLFGWGKASHTTSSASTSGNRVVPARNRAARRERPDRSASAPAKTPPTRSRRTGCCSAGAAVESAELGSGRASRRPPRGSDRAAKRTTVDTISSGCCSSTCCCSSPTSASEDRCRRWWCAYWASTPVSGRYASVLVLGGRVAAGSRSTPGPGRSPAPCPGGTSAPAVTVTDAFGSRPAARSG